MPEIPTWRTMARDNILPIVAIVVVAAALIGLAYANIVGIIQLSGMQLVDSTTATIIVAVLFLLMVPWAYNHAKSS